jgi:hypothetical protein
MRIFGVNEGRFCGGASPVVLKEDIEVSDAHQKDQQLPVNFFPVSVKKKVLKFLLEEREGVFK